MQVVNRTIARDGSDWASLGQRILEAASFAAFNHARLSPADLAAHLSQEVAESKAAMALCGVGE